MYIVFKTFKSYKNNKQFSNKECHAFCPFLISRLFSAHSGFLFILGASISSLEVDVNLGTMLFMSISAGSAKLYTKPFDFFIFRFISSDLSSATDFPSTTKSLPDSLTLISSGLYPEMLICTWNLQASDTSTASFAS